MRHWFVFFLLSAAATVSGCGIAGESTLDAMKRRAKSRGDAAELEEKQAQQRIAQAQKNVVKSTADEDATPATPVVTQPPASNKGKAAPSNTKAKTAKAGGAAIAKAPANSSPELPISGRPPIPFQPNPPLTEIQRRNKSAANLEQIVSALNQYAREKGTYPTQAIVSQPLGRPLLSWRVAILPYLGLADFYQEFHLNEPWDSPHNLQLAAHVPPVFVSPERCDEKTNYLAPHGPGAAWDGIRGKDPLSFGDGADTTLIVIEADDESAVPWTRPDDLPIADGKVKSRLGKLRGEGFLAAFGSGYVVMIHNRITDGQLSWALSTDGDDFLTDRTIIFDATVPDVALVTSDKRPDDEPGGSAASDTKTPKDGTKEVTASDVGSSAPHRIRGLPPVKLPPPPTRPIRLAVPPEEELAKAREQLRQIYEQEYRDGKTKQERQKLATKMLADAARLAEEIAAFHEILRMARDIAVQVGDITTALKAVELLETRLEIPPLELRLKTLDELTATMSESTQGATQVAAEAEKVLRIAYEADDFSTALQAHQIHMAMLRMGNDRAKTARAGAYRHAILEAEKMYKLVPAALSALAGNPENTEANEVAGKYFCLVKEQWETGLPMMARGQDLKLRILARMDLEKDKSGAQTVQLADQYWDLAEEFKHPQRRSLQLRAAYQYASAMPYLKPGVDLVKAEKRIEEVKRTYGTEVLAKSSGAGPPMLPTPMVSPKDDSG